MKNNVPRGNIPSSMEEIPKKVAGEDSFLEVVRLLREEILDTLNQKIDLMQNQIQHLQQQTYQSPLPTSLPTQYSNQPIPIPRHVQNLPHQNQFNPTLCQ